MALFYGLQKLRASDLNKIVPQYALKDADESVSTASTGTTLHDDLKLFVSLAANATYAIDLTLIYIEAVGTGIDIKAAWTFPTGCTLNFGSVGPHNAWVAAAGAALEAEWAAWQNVTASPSSSITFGTTNVASFTMRANGIIQVGSTAGTLRFQWAQANGSASNLTVKAGSSLKATYVV